MPIILFIILIVLIAQFGFWDTFQAVLGAVGFVILMAVLVVALVVLGTRWLMTKGR